MAGENEVELRKRPRSPGNDDVDGDDNGERDDVSDDNNEGTFPVVFTSGVGRNVSQRPGSDCPYMDTVNRSVLDFDFEKVCCVSLENHNVYACLVCGKYFQGRGRTSHANTHSLDQGHHVFINLDTEKIYCLPDGYEIIDASLDDIKHAVNPQQTKDQVMSLNSDPKRFRTLDGTIYSQGVMGMNNLHATDYANAVLQALFVVSEGTLLMRRLGELVRKVYNNCAFRTHVSPHEFMQEVVTRSEKRFQILAQGDPVEYIAWLLNTLQADLADKNGQSIVSRTFRGEIKVTSVKDRGPLRSSQDVNGGSMVKKKVQKVPFFFLSLDLPARPLFKDAMDRKLLPQIPLHNLLAKFDGVREHHVVKTGERRVYRIEKLPQYLIMHIKRFTKNNFFLEKNPTIVPFPAANLEMKDFVPDFVAKTSKSTKYDLVAAVTHEGEPKGGTYMVNIKHPPTSQWYQIQDLNIRETFPQLVTLAEAHILIYEAQTGTSE